MNRRVAAALLATVALPGIARAQATASDFTHATRYDAMRRVVGTIAPDPDGSGGLHYAAVRNTYDQDGRLVRVEKGELSNWQNETVAPANWPAYVPPSGSTPYSGFMVLRRIDTDYDAMDRKVVDKAIDRSTGSAATLTHYGYDAVGRLQCTAVRMNPAAFSSLPTSACTLDTQGSDGPDRIAKNVYDDVGQLLQVRRAVGTSIEQAYETYSYTDNGKQADIVDANGNRAHMVYDGHDRALQWQFPSTTGPSAYNGATPASALQSAGAVNTNDYEQYGYDADGNRTSLRKRDGRTFGYTYDALNRMTVKTVPTACVSGYACTTPPSWATRSVFYAYDAWGRQTEARYDSAGAADGVFSGYDGFGRLTSSRTAMNSTSRQMTFVYDADGNRTQVTFPDSQMFTYSYDGLDRENLIQQPGGAGLVSFSYDATGQRNGAGRGNYTTSGWSYDSVGRLNGLSHDLTGSGNDLSYGFGYNPASQIRAGRRATTSTPGPAARTTARAMRSTVSTSIPASPVLGTATTPTAT